MSQKEAEAPVYWQDDKIPYSPRFDDIYHTESGAFEQATHVFLHGCELPEQWHREDHYTILETGFGLGLNFLTTWYHWQRTASRPRRLHFVSVEAFPALTDDVKKACAQIPELQALGDRLLQQYPIPLPGLHRLVFHELNQDHVILTLAIGDAKNLLPQMHLEADAIFLDGFSPQKNPELWNLNTCKQLAKLAKSAAKISTWCVAGQVRRNLQAAGFEVQKVAGLPPKKESLQGTYSQKNLTRRKRHTQAGTTSSQKEVAIIGAGFAGANLAWALGQRGWSVQLYDQAPYPAKEASGLPIGLGIPNVSKDDALLTQITRAGAQWLRYVVEACDLKTGHWNDAPIEQIVKTAEQAALPKAWGSYASHVFTPDETDEGQPCRHFHHGMRLEGRPFVEALLKEVPQLTSHWNTKITHITQDAINRWQLFDQNEACCGSYQHVVVATAMESLALTRLNHPAITANRGQITLGLRASLPPPPNLLTARTGYGHFLLPLRDDTDWSWSMGSTFAKDEEQQQKVAESHQENHRKLQKLSPKTAQKLQAQFDEQRLDAFTGIRCTTADHLPLVGAVPHLTELQKADAQHLMTRDIPTQKGLFILAGFGSRGLTTAPLCAELLASMMNDEPWPLTTPQAEALHPARFILRESRKIKQ